MKKLNEIIRAVLKGEAVPEKTALNESKSPAKTKKRIRLRPRSDREWKKFYKTGTTPEKKDTYDHGSEMVNYLTTQAIKLGKKKVNEAEQIDELSRGKLMNYRSRAERSVLQLNKDAESTRKEADKVAFPGTVHAMGGEYRKAKPYREKAKELRKQAFEKEKKAYFRNVFVDLAKDKMRWESPPKVYATGSEKPIFKGRNPYSEIAEEAEQIDELSSKLLKRYAKKAISSVDKMRKKGIKAWDDSDRLEAAAEKMERGKKKAAVHNKAADTWAKGDASYKKASRREYWADTADHKIAAHGLTRLKAKRRFGVRVPANEETQLDEGNDLNFSNGFLKIRGNQKKVDVYYGGNMGDSEEDVQEKFDEIYGNGTFKKVRKVAKKITGSADISWNMEVSRSDFNKLAGKPKATEKQLLKKKIESIFAGPEWSGMTLNTKKNRTSRR